MADTVEREAENLVLYPVGSVESENVHAAFDHVGKRRFSAKHRVGVCQVNPTIR